MIFTLFPDYFSRQTKRRQTWRQTLPQGEKRKKRETAFPIRSPLAII